MLLMAIHSTTPDAVAQQDGATEWRISSVPDVSIGNPQEGFAGDFLRITGATVLQDGRIIIADQAPRQSVFQADGSHVTSIGRSGQGPGEFTSIQWIRSLNGDSVLVWDPVQYRLSTFGPDGSLAAGLTLRGAPPPHVVGRFADGSLLAWSVVDYPAGATGVYTLTYQLLRLSSSGGVLAEFARVPGGQMYSGGQRGTRIRGAGHVLRETRVLVDEDRVLVGTGERFEVTVFDGAGDVVVSLESTAVPMPATPEYVGQVYPPRWARLLAENLPQGHLLPATRGILVDSEGLVWVEHHPGDLQRPSRWIVFGATGAVAAEATVPAGLQLLEVGADYVLGVWRDDLDVESVRKHALTRGGSTS
jgi:hypothetical protein